MIMDQPTFDPRTIERAAVISDCGQFRYRLMRRWAPGNLVLFIMLNPSTADADVDDPTIRRCMRFAHAWGYGGLWVGNLFPYRSTDPRGLFREANSQASWAENMMHLAAMDHDCELVVCAWGNGSTAERVKGSRLFGWQYKPLEVVTKPLHYLALAKDGTPKHPLYLKGDLKPQLIEVPPRRAW